MVASVNVHDSRLFDKSFFDFLEFAELNDFNINDSALVLDSGFYSQSIANEICYGKMEPVIKPNIGARKNREKIYQILDDFESVKHIYKERFVIERTFAWEDTYRRLNVRYDRLNSTFNGFRYVAYSMINFRWLFGKKL